MRPLPPWLLDSLLAFSLSAFNGYYTCIYIHGLFKVTVLALCIMNIELSADLNIE